LRFSSYRTAPLGATKGTVMDRYISLLTNSVSIVCVEIVVVGVAILGAVALLHARAPRWRWAPAETQATGRRRS